MARNLHYASAGVLCTGAVLVSSMAASAGPPPVRYAVTDLGLAVGAFGINSRGEVVGIFHGAEGQYHGFHSSGGVFTDIGSLGGHPTFARAINDAGEIVGSSITPRGEEHAFVRRGEVMIDLGTFGGTYSHANDISSTGMIVGDAQTRGHGGGHGDEHACVWLDGRTIDLGTLGGAYSTALGVNDLGQVVGWAWNPEWRSRPFIWTEITGMIDLGTLGGISGSARDVNSFGEVVGSSRLPEGLLHATLWRDGQIIDLGVLPEAGKQGPYGPELIETYATAINDAGVIVGNSSPAFIHSGAFLWRDGEIVSVSSLIDPESGWRISTVSNINNHGQITATARGADGFYHAVRLTPVRAAGVAGR